MFVEQIQSATKEGFASVHAPVAFGEGKEQTSSETFDAQFAAGGGSRAIEETGSKAAEELLAVRRDKLERWRRDGFDPFGGRYARSHTTAQVVEGHPANDGQTVAVAGRLMAMRGHGKAAFADLQDAAGKIQLYFREDVLGEAAYARRDLLDLGDIIGAGGKVFRTRRGEVSVEVAEFVPLAKSLLPLPEKWHGLRDVEARYRQRYLDLIVNQGSREIFAARTKILREIRSFLDERGFQEVETPVLTSVAGGAAARPFHTHHNALDLPLTLRIALELPLKRLLVGGIERVYELGRVFRNEGVSTRHNPEFTILELYQAYADYGDMMDLTEGLVAHLARKVTGSSHVVYQGEDIRLEPPWARVSFLEAVKDHTGVDFGALAGAAAARDAGEKLGLEVPPAASWGKVVDLAFQKFAEPHFRQPTFLTDYPVDISPLAKRRADDPRLTHRFEAIVVGRELANAFSELNDPLDQRRRLLEQVAERAAGDAEAHEMDEDFVTAMEYGMPPAGGLGIGIDRLVMLLTDAASIREVILFPLLRP